MSWPYPGTFDANIALSCANLVQQAYFQLFVKADDLDPQAFPPPFGFSTYPLQMPPSGYNLEYTITYSAEPEPFNYFGYVVTGPSVLNSGNTMAALVLRGTESMAEWESDILDSGQTTFTDAAGNPLGLVHEGFNTTYNGLSYTDNSGNSSTLSGVLSYLYSSSTGDMDLVITGHSLGGALATLMAMDVAANDLNSDYTGMTCYTFGSPQVGDPTFAANFNNYVANGTILNYSVANGLDPVPGLPPSVYYFTDLLDPTTPTECDYQAVNNFCPISSGLVDFDFHSLNAYAIGLNNLITPPTSLALPRRVARRRPARTRRLPIVAVPPSPIPVAPPSA
jgi:hypothetical protein